MEMFYIAKYDLIFYANKKCYSLTIYGGRGHAPAYGRNQSGCEKAKNLVFLPSILWVFLTI